MTSVLNEKIKNLELEGLKLRSQVESILNENHESLSGNYDSVTESDSSTTERDPRVPFSHIYEATRNNGCSYKLYELKSGVQKDSNSIRRELEDTKDKLAHMQHKMKQECQLNQMERDKLMKSLDELESVKCRLEGDLNRISREFEKRVHQKENMICELKNQLSQIVSVNKKQEQLLSESAHKLTELESSQTCMSSLRQLRCILKNYENNCRGGGAFCVESLDDCSISSLVSYVDRCFQELSDCVEAKNCEMRGLEDELEFVKRNAARDKDKAVMEYKHNLTYQEEQNNYMKKRMEEHQYQAEREMDKMRKELQETQRKLDEEMSEANKIIDGLESNMREMSAKYDQSYEMWAHEKCALQDIVDENEKVLVALRGERDVSATQKSSVLAKLDAAQSKLVETENQLLQYQTEKFGHDNQLCMLKKRNSELEASLTATRVCLESITKTALHNNRPGDTADDQDEGWEESGDENIRALIHCDEEKLPWKPKKYEVQEVIKHIKSVNKKLVECQEELNKTKDQEKSLRKQIDATNQQKRRSEQNIKSRELEVDGLRQEIEHLNTLMCTRNGEVERLTAERDYYFQMLNEKSEELTNCKTENHRLTVTINPKMEVLQQNFDQLEERCRQLETTPISPEETCDDMLLQHINQLHQQQHQQPHQSDFMNNSSSVLMVQKEMEIIKHKYQSLKQQKVHLETQNREMKLAMKEESHNVTRKLASKIDKLEMDKKNLESELKAVVKDYDDLQAENKRLQTRLKDCDKEINNLCHEIQSYSSQKTRKHVSLEKKLVDLTAELTKTKSELKLVEDRLHSVDKKNSPNSPHNNNSTPSIVLNEITENSANTSSQNKTITKETKQRIANMEEQMRSLESNYTGVQQENAKLTSLLKRVTNQNERLTEELENYAYENGKLRESSKDHSSTDKKTRTRSFDRYSAESRNTDRQPYRTDLNRGREDVQNESNPIKSLRSELEESIKEARKLLSNHHDKYDKKTSGNYKYDDNNDDKDENSTNNSTSNNVNKSHYSGSAKSTPKTEKQKNGILRSQINGYGSNNSNSSGLEGEKESAKNVKISKELPEISNKKTIPKDTNPNSSNKNKAQKTKPPITIEKDNTNNNNDSESLSSSLTEVDSHIIQLNHSSNQRPPLPNPTNKNKSSSKNVSANQNRAPSPVERLLSPTGLDNMGISTYHPNSNRDSYQLEEKIKRVLSET